MNVLFDVVHPAHVHFYKNLARDLSQQGDRVLFVGRSRDMVESLLENLDFEWLSVGRPRSSRVGQGAELVDRVYQIASIARSYSVDVICTRNPAGAIAGSVIPGIVSIFDTDDGPAAGAIYWLGSSFATIITSPTTVAPSIKWRKLKSYRGFKASAYLHPDRFRPDRTVPTALGIDFPYAVARFVSMNAVHDHGEEGLSGATKSTILSFLSERMPVVLSEEQASFSTLRNTLSVPSEAFLDVLGHASVYAGDSQSVAIEACLLGTPALHVNSWAGRLDAFRPLTDNGLLISLRPDSNEILPNLEFLVRQSNTESRRRDTIEWVRANSDDVTLWYRELLEGLRDA